MNCISFPIEALSWSLKVLEILVELMVHCFGESIFNCIVLIATVNPDVCQFIPPDIYCPLLWWCGKNEILKVILSHVLPQGKWPPNDKPPISFISMNNSCEEIYWKIKYTPVIVDEVQLAFDYSTFSICGIKAKSVWWKKTKVACYVDEDPSTSIGYKESLSDYFKALCDHQDSGRFCSFYYIQIIKVLGKWPDFHNTDDKVCINCGQVPGTRGCANVNTRYTGKPKGRVGELNVDH